MASETNIKRRDSMWIFFASGSAIFAGLTSILAKCGIKNTAKGNSKIWILYAFGSAFFASLTSILGKVGITNINSNLGTAIRTVVVLIMAWIVVFVTGKGSKENIKKGAGLYFLVRNCHRSFLALLLQSFAGGTCQRSCTY